MCLALLRFKLFVYKADAMHASTGKWYYVIPYPNSNFKLLVLCNDDIKQLKKRHILKKNVTHLTVMYSCLYFTNCGGKKEGKMDKPTLALKYSNWKTHIKNRLKLS